MTHKRVIVVVVVAVVCCKKKSLKSQFMMIVGIGIFNFFVLFLQYSFLVNSIVELSENSRSNSTEIIIIWKREVKYVVVWEKINIYKCLLKKICLNFVRSFSLTSTRHTFSCVFLSLPHTIYTRTESTELNTKAI